MQRQLSKSVIVSSLTLDEKRLTAANRHIQVKAPPPGRSISDDTSKKWAYGSTDSGSQVNNRHVLATLSKRNKVSNDRLDQKIDATTTETLDGASSDEHRHGTRATAKSATKSEYCDCSEKQDTTSEDITGLCEQWKHCHGSKQVGIWHPDVRVATAESFRDGWKGAGNDGSFQGRYQSCDHEGHNDGPEAPCSHGSFGVWCDLC